MDSFLLKYHTIQILNNNQKFSERDSISKFVVTYPDYRSTLLLFFSVFLHLFSPLPFSIHPHYSFCSLFFTATNPNSPPHLFLTPMPPPYFPSLLILHFPPCLSVSLHLYPSTLSPSLLILL